MHHQTCNILLIIKVDNIYFTCVTKQVVDKHRRNNVKMTRQFKKQDKTHTFFKKQFYIGLCIIHTYMAEVYSIHYIAYIVLVYITFHIMMYSSLFVGAMKVSSWVIVRCHWFYGTRQITQSISLICVQDCFDRNTSNPENTDIIIIIIMMDCHFVILSF